MLFYLGTTQAEVVAFWTTCICATLTLVSIIMSFVSIWHHVKFKHRPLTRILIIRVLLMVPIYAVEAFGSLEVPNAYIYLDAIRDTYEAFIIYSFYCLLIEGLGGDGVLADNLRRVDEQEHIWPMNFLRTWAMPDVFMSKCKFGTLQYCFVQPICVLITFILEVTGTYEEGSFKYNVGYPYIAFIRSASQTWAIYCLVLFYMGLHKMPEEYGGESFETMRIVPKFLCIKGVVFFTFWQSLLLAFLVEIGLISATGHWSSTNISVRIQDFIIIVEMVGFAAAHIWAFRPDDFEKENEGEPLISTHSAIGQAIFQMPRDIVSDAHQVVFEPYNSNILVPNRANYRLPTFEESHEDENSRTPEEHAAEKQETFATETN